MFGAHDNTAHISGEPTTICVVGLRGIPGVMGGAETHCEHLYPLIAKNSELRIVVFGRRAYKKGTTPFDYRGVTVVPTWTIRGKYLEAIVHTGWALMIARFRYRADILHIHSIGPGLWSPIARLLGMKVVVTCHGEDHKQEKWNWFARFVLRTGEKVSARFANAMIVVNASLCERLKARYPRLKWKFFAIANGADHFTAADRQSGSSTLAELGLTPKNYVLSVGRLIPDKGFDELIDAYEASGPRDHPLVIVGKADHPDAFTRGLLQRQSSHVIFAGFQPKSSVAALCANAALCVSASHHEGNPIVALEAVSVGAPLLLSDIAPHLDLGLPSKHYFPVRDKIALAKKLSAPFEQYSYDGRQIMARFTWGAAALKTQQIYVTLMALTAPLPAT